MTRYLGTNNTSCSTDVANHSVRLQCLSSASNFCLGEHIFSTYLTVVPFAFATV